MDSLLYIYHNCFVSCIKTRFGAVCFSHIHIYIYIYTIASCSNIYGYTDPFFKLYNLYLTQCIIINKNLFITLFARYKSTNLFKCTQNIIQKRTKYCMTVNFMILNLNFYFGGVWRFYHTFLHLSSISYLKFNVHS